MRTLSLRLLARWSLVLASGSLGTSFAQDDLGAAQSEFAAGDLEAARLRTDRILETSPDSAAARMLLAEILEAMGDDGADAAIDHALDLAGDDSGILSRAAALYAARASDYYASESSYLASDPRRKAEELLARWAELDPATTLPTIRAAALLRDAGERTIAAGLVLAAVARDTANAEGHDVLWSFLGREVGFEQLAGFYRGLSEGEGDPLERARCRNYESQVWKRAGNAEWNAAFAARDRGERSTHISRLEAANGCYRRAIDAARASARIVPSWETDVAVAIADLHGCIVRVLGEQRDLPAARRAVEVAMPDLRAALSAAPSNPTARAALELVADGLFLAWGDVASDVARMKGAMAELADLWAFATEHVVDSAEWWNNLGFTARESARYEASYAAYERCIALAPDSVRYLNDTGLILLYHLHRDRDRAETLFRRAVELGAVQYAALAPDDPSEPELRSAYGDALLNLGLILARTERPAEADAPLLALERLDASRLDLVEARLEQALAKGDANAARAAMATIVQVANAPGDEADAMLEIFAEGARHYEFESHVALRDELLATATETRARLREAR